jgi:hypothetical protein
MLDDDRAKKPPGKPRSSSLSKWIDGLGAAEKLLAGLTAVVVAIGVLGTGVYYARNAWIKIIGPTGNAGAPAAAPTPSPTSPSPIPTTFGSAQISNVKPSGGGSCIGNSVQVTVNVSDPASAGRELWLMAVVMTGTPIHPVYYAKHKVANTAGAHRVNIQFIGAPVGSARNLVMVGSAQKSLNWLQDNLANDGNPGWDIHRTGLPSDVQEISRPYRVIRRC